MQRMLCQHRLSVAAMTQAGLLSVDGPASSILCELLLLAMPPSRLSEHRCMAVYSCCPIPPLLLLFLGRCAIQVVLIGRKMCKLACVKQTLQPSMSINGPVAACASSCKGYAALPDRGR